MDLIKTTGFNSFNFLTFMLLTFNLMANINNNINNNNNNNNDNNINAIDQNSQNTVTNTNSGNQISVTVLPIPGKRSFRTLRSISSGYNNQEKNKSYHSIANALLSHLIQVQNKAREVSKDCESFEYCAGTKRLMNYFEIENAISMSLLYHGIDPNLKKLSCEKLFPNCD